MTFKIPLFPPNSILDRKGRVFIMTGYSVIDAIGFPEYGVEYLHASREFIPNYYIEFYGTKEQVMKDIAAFGAMACPMEVKK